MITQADLREVLSCQSFWIYTDGSATTHGVRSGSYAAMILGDKGRPFMVAGASSETTINRMELTAINAAIYRIREISRNAVHGVTVTITTDSQVTANLILGQSKRGSNIDLWAQFDALSCGFDKISVIHIPRNTEPPQGQADVICDAVRRVLHEVVTAAVNHPRFDTFEIPRGFSPFVDETSVNEAMRTPRLQQVFDLLSEQVQFELDEEVANEMDRQKSDLNNSGAHEQVRYLLKRGWTVESIIKIKTQYDV